MFTAWKKLSRNQRQSWQLVAGVITLGTLVKVSQTFGIVFVMEMVVTMSVFMMEYDRFIEAFYFSKALFIVFFI